MPQTVTAEGRVPLPGLPHVKENAAPLYGKYPEAGEHAEHRRRVDGRYEQQRKGARLEMQELQDDVVGINSDKAFARGLDYEIKDGNGKVLPTKREQFDAEILAKKTAMESLSATTKALPRNRIDEIDKAASNAFKAGLKFNQLAMADFAVPEGVTLAEGFAALDAAKAAKEKIVNANLPTEEVNAQLALYFEEIKNDHTSSLGLAALCAGSGGASIALPSFVDLAQPSQKDGHTHAFMLPDIWKVLIVLDHDDSFLKKVQASVEKYNAQFPQVGTAERATLLKAHDAKILDAARRLEFICRREEAKGIPVKRPRDCAWTTMLWLEPAPRLKVVTPNDFEGE